MPTKSILLYMLIVTLSFSSINLKAQSKQNQITVDGFEDDWKTNVFNVDSANGFEYSISKTDDRLFLIIKFVNKLSQIKSLTTGMQIGLDMYNKNKPQQFINFPLDNSSKVNPAELFADLNMMQYSLLLMNTEYELRKFVDGNGTYKYDAENTNGIILAFATNKDDQLVYEYSIPFESLRNKKDPPGLTSTAIDIEINIPALRINTSPPSTGNQTGSFNSRMGVTSSAKQNKAPTRSPSGNPMDGLKEQYKEMFENTKKKIRITL